MNCEQFGRDGDTELTLFRSVHPSIKAGKGEITNLMFVWGESPTIEGPSLTIDAAFLKGSRTACLIIALDCSPLRVD